jgi:hypothetical protein
MALGSLEVSIQTGSPQIDLPDQNMYLELARNKQELYRAIVAKRIQVRKAAQAR